MGVAQKAGVPKSNPGKWKHGPKPAVCPSWLILSHAHMVGFRRFAHGSLQIPRKGPKFHNPIFPCALAKELILAGVH